MDGFGGLLETVTSFDAFRESVEELVSTEGRIVVTVGILLVTVLVTALLAPRIVSWAGRTFDDRMPAGRTKSTFEFVIGYIPTTFGSLVVRVLQLGILLVAIVALLVVWGLVDVAVTILRILGISLPVLALLFTTLVLFFLAYVAADLLEEAVKQFGEGADRITEHQEEIVLRVGHLTILLFVVGGALTLWGVNLSGLLVGAGFLGIVVGFAAQKTLGSVISGFILMFSRPFTIGDWVEVDENEGIVTDITIVNTHMKNFDGEYIVIPNDLVSNSPITNRSKVGHLRTRVEVGIDYAADPERASEVAIDAMNAVDHVVDSPAPQVVTTNFDDSAIGLELRFWIDHPTPPRRWQAIDAVVESVKTHFEEAGIKIPYPQRELSGRAETGGFRVAGSSPDTAETTDLMGEEGHTDDSSEQPNSTRDGSPRTDVDEPIE